MAQSTRLMGLCVAASVAAFAGQAFGQGGCTPSTGPDVIVGDLPNTSNYSPLGGIDAYSMATTSCNIGDTNLLWNAFPANTHPAITQTMYRFRTVNGTGRFEMIGQSWLKHGFTALTGNVCCTCNSPGSGSLLGVGCSDPYTASRNASQGGLGPKWQVNAHTGFFPTGGPATGTGGSGSVYRRLQFALSDVVASTGGPSAAQRFFGESQYVSQDDAAAGNQNNNASYRELAITGSATDWTVNFSTAAGAVVNTSRMNPAIRAWALCEPGVTLTDVQVPDEGLFIVGSKATSLGGGMWHYEYAVLNLNSDRSGGTFSVPVPAGASVTNIEFHSPKYHSGDGDGNINFSNAAWTTSRNGDSLDFVTETQAQNIRANALRWGTTYNFRFDSNAAPVVGGNVKIGMWKPGTPSAVIGNAQSPGMFPVPPEPLQAVGSSSPASVAITGTALLTVAVTPATQPVSSGVTVTGNLASINGSATQSFYDDGTHGDVTAGDLVFSYLATMSEPLTAGTKNIPFHVADLQDRELDSSFNITLTSAPSGACCTAGNCTITTEYACVTGGGTYNGNGTNCGASTYSVGAGTGSYSSIHTTGTMATVVSNCDDCSEGVSIPFPFTFFNNVYNNVFIHSNGYLQFGTSNVQYNNTPIPSAALPNNAIYARWDDLNTTTGGEVYHQTVGTAPNRTFIVQWHNVAQHGLTPVTSENFQVLLSEGTNHVEFRYGAISQDPGTDTTVGIENSTGTVAHSISGPSLGTGNTSRRISSIAPQSPCAVVCGTADFDGDGDTGTDADIEAFFACLAGNCCATCYSGGADFDADGDTGTDADIESFFRVLAGGPC
jgi:hypothetical protein